MLFFLFLKNIAECSASLQHVFTGVIYITQRNEGVIFMYRKNWLFKTAGILLSASMVCLPISALAEGNGGTPPSRGQPNGQPPSGSAPSGQPGGSGQGGQPGGGGQSSAVTSWTAASEISEDTNVTNPSYASTDADENALHISNGTVILNNPSVIRTNNTSTGGDNASFYGVGASVLATGGTSYINGGDIASDAKGAAGIFSYGDGVVYAGGTKIHTKGDAAGGIHVAGGGTLYAYDMDVTTEGNSSAAIRSDRGGGTMVVDGGTYTSNGTGSPAVYVTADITVNDADLTANGSEGVCIEGLNTLRLFNSNLTSTMADDNQNDNTWSVILYQSMSGDSEVGNSSFYMIGGSLNSKNGGLFYSTNTSSDFYLNNVSITQAADSEYFLRVTGNSNQRGWGASGSNGADTNFTAVNQKMNGSVIWDSISKLDFYMQDGSVLTGAVIDDESCAGNGGSGYANIYIDKDSKWIVTGNSTLTNLYNEGTVVDPDGKTVSIVGTDGTNYVTGSSAYTVTISSYSTSADFSGAVAEISYNDYKVEAPDELTVLNTLSTSVPAPTEDTAVQNEVVNAISRTPASATASASTSDSSTALLCTVVTIAILGTVCVVLIGKRKKKN
jgi:hypothetical protein